jgi:hypothetical protein
MRGIVKQKPLRPDDGAIRQSFRQIAGLGGRDGETSIFELPLNRGFYSKRYCPQKKSTFFNSFEAEFVLLSEIRGSGFHNAGLG